jgi:hypothetical protein
VTSEEIHSEASQGPIGQTVAVQTLYYSWLFPSTLGSLLLSSSLLPPPSYLPPSTPPPSCLSVPFLSMVDMQLGLQEDKLGPLGHLQAV